MPVASCEECDETLATASIASPKSHVCSSLTTLHRCVGAGPLAVAASQNEEVEEPWSTYLHLWRAILLDNTPGNAASTKPKTPSKAASTKVSSSSKAAGVKLGLHASNVSSDAAAAQRQLVYDALIRAIMDAIRNLDLEYHQAEGGVQPRQQDQVTSPDRKRSSTQVRSIA